MIYIGATEHDGNAIYLDVHAAERCGPSVCISGTVGDGQYEGEVVVQIGRSDSVAFADAWLGGGGLDDFLARCGAGSLEQALVETVRELPLFGVPRDQPHGYKPDVIAPRRALRGRRRLGTA